MARRTVLAAVAAVALVASFGAACAPATPEESIVFAAGPRSPDYGEIFRVDLHGHRVNLTRTPHAVEMLASDDVSHDGRWIAFTRQPPAPDDAPEALFLMHT